MMVHLIIPNMKTKAIDSENAHTSPLNLDSILLPPQLFFLALTTNMIDVEVVETPSYFSKTGIIGGKRT